MPNINIFGVHFAYPRGLRKSPGVNRIAACVGMELSGKTGGTRGDVKKRFTAAAKACAGKL